MCKDGKFELYDEGVENINAFFVARGKCVGDSGRLFGMIEGIEGTEKWIAEWRIKGDDGREGLLLGRAVARVKEKELVRNDRVVMENVLKWWEGGNTCCFLMFGT